MRIHGQYCGPGWSDGIYQNSVVGLRPPDDDFDATCMAHDASYALGADLASADLLFASENFGQGVVPTFAALAVGAQGLLRAADKYLPTFIENDNMNRTPNLRGSARNVLGTKNKQQKSPIGQPANRKAPGLDVSRQYAPNAIGTSMRATPPTITRSATSARVQGRDFIGTVEGQGVATFGLGKSALLSPAYFSSTVLGNMARSFERYRWNTLRVHYVPKVATTAVGQVVLCSQHSVSEPGLQPEAGNFLPRAMSQGNAAFSPLWTPSYIDIACDGSWKLVDPTTTSDIDDTIHEELQVYTQVSVAGQVGYLFAEYDVSFQDPIYTPHSTALPIFTGPGQRVTLASNLAVNALNAAWNLAEVSGTGAFISAVPGTIFRAVFDLQGSSASGGTTFAAALFTTTYRHDTVATIGNNAIVTPLNGGLTVYFVTNGANVFVYVSLEAAVNGSGTGQLFHNLPTTTVGAFNFDLAMVRIGTSSLPSIQ